MSDDERLVGISLAGFQVFEELTEIPFGRITLLYGPNSAGKSAVEDALAVLRDVWCRDNNEIDYDAGKRGQLLKRHWRHIDEIEIGTAAELTVVLAAKIIVPIPKLLGHIESFTTSTEFYYSPTSSDLCGQLELRLTYSTHLYGPPTPDIDSVSFMKRNLDVLLDGKSLISFKEDFEEDSCCTITVNHPGLSHWKAPILKNVKIPTRLGKHTRTSISENEWQIRGRRLRLTREHFFDLECVLTDIKARKNDVVTYLAAFKAVFDSVVSACKVIASNAFRIDVVPASRKIPSRTDLLHFFMGPTQVIHWNEPQAAGGPPITPEYDTTVVDLRESYGIQELGDPLYRELARSMGFALLVAKDRSGDEMHEVEQAKERRFRGIGEQVNRMLTDHLFRERGYRLAADYRFLLSRKELEEMVRVETMDAFDITYLPILVRLFLVDAKGRRFNFDQVGSGLGYVLPVLAALFSARNGVLVQQPELHLHPALQAELGDVIVEAHHGNSNPIIVETHSEHLLLRILRRVRRTHRGQQVEPELQVRASDISVLYFNPTPSGVTHVKQLRISEDGDFMDRWPRGFFAERDEELFDE